MTCTLGIETLSNHLIVTFMLSAKNTNKTLVPNQTNSHNCTCGYMFFAHVFTGPFG